MSTNLPYMIDIETYGQRPTSVILSIGCVQFDPARNVIVREMPHVNIDIEDAEFYGLTRDPETVVWWSDQSAAAKARTFNRDTAIGLKPALQKLDQFIRDGGSGDMWACGTDFDLPILANAFRSVGMETPWPYWVARDYRTLKQLFPNIRYNKPKAAHDALEDAKAQATHLMRILKHIDSLTNLDTLKSNAVIAAQSDMRDFLTVRGFGGDYDRTRAVLVEWEKYKVEAKRKKAEPATTEDEL